MKQPLVILALASIATFTMGWFAHRVFLKSTVMLPAGVSLKADSSEPADSLKPLPEDTLFTRHMDTSRKMEEYPAVLVSAVADTLWNDEKELILKKPGGEIEIHRKFNPHKSFRDYSVTTVYKSKNAKTLDYSTSKYARLYKSATKKAFQSGPVFAGRYAFAISSCGNGCFASTIVDMKTGKVYDGPHASSGYQYKLESRLLVVNPPPSGGLYMPCDYCEPELYVWTGKEFRRLE